MLSKAFQMSNEVYLAMQARGFRGEVYLLDDFLHEALEQLQLGGRRMAVGVAARLDDGNRGQRAARDVGVQIHRILDVLRYLIATQQPGQKILYFASSTAAPVPSQLPLLLEKRPDLGMTPNDDGVELRMRGEAMRQLWIAADTRESDVAVYLDSWRRKIERVGTMNFPDIARRQKLSGTPVIEVTIGANGNLLQTIVRRTSGHPEIDEAAMRILKLAAPFDPFPGELSAKHDEIRIAYEWQFLGGASQGTGVFYSEPSH